MDLCEFYARGASSRSITKDAVPVAINGRTVDPQKACAQDAEKASYVTIRALSPLNQESEAELQDLGVTIQEQVDLETYLCRYEPSDLEPIRAKPYIQQVDVYRNKFKITQDPKTTNTLVASQSDPIEGASMMESSINPPLPTNGVISANTLSSTCTVDVLLHRELTTNANEIAFALAAKACVNNGGMEVTSEKVRMTMDRKYLKDVASDDRVRAIGEVFLKIEHKNYAREIMQADIRLNDIVFH